MMHSFVDGKKTTYSWFSLFPNKGIQSTRFSEIWRFQCIFHNFLLSELLHPRLVLIGLAMADIGFLEIGHKLPFAHGRISHKIRKKTFSSLDTCSFNADKSAIPCWSCCKTFDWSEKMRLPAYCHPDAHNSDSMFVSLGGKKNNFGSRCKSSTDLKFKFSLFVRSQISFLL